MDTAFKVVEVSSSHKTSLDVKNGNRKVQGAKSELYVYGVFRAGEPLSRVTNS